MVLFADSKKSELYAAGLGGAGCSPLSLVQVIKRAAGLFLAAMLSLALVECRATESDSPSTKAQRQAPDARPPHLEQISARSDAGQTPGPSAETIKIDYKTLLPRYADTFTHQLDLILTEYWSEDGNWKADMMNDATAFAPKLLFKMYERTGCEELYNRAAITCKYQNAMIKDVFLGKQQFDINSIFGVYCLLAPMRHAKTPQERDANKFLLQSIIYLMNNTLLWDADQSLLPDLKEYKSIALPMAASLSLEFCQVEKQDIVLQMARRLVEKHEKEFYDKTTGLFRGKHFGTWNSALGLLAYARAYAVTEESQYLQKADTLIDNLSRTNPVFAGVLFDPDVLQEQKNWSLYFSTLLIYIDAFWELYRSTGDEEYRDAVERAIDFAVAEFILSRAYPGGINDKWFDNQKRVVPFYSHDIHRVEGVKKVAPSYCLGCTFSMLNHIWNYNHDTPTRSSMSSSSPNPKPLCLKVCLPRH